MIYSKSVSFSYNEEKFEYPVDYIDDDSSEESIVDYKNTTFFHMIESERLKDELDEVLPNTNNKKKKIKY